jgi:outer membrane protein OmpA-like peptidoglycan-associated protein
MHRSATIGCSLFWMLAVAIGGTGATAWAQTPPRPESQRTAVPPAARMPDANALRTPAPPAIGETAPVPAPSSLPGPLPRTAAPAAPSAPGSAPPVTTSVVPLPIGEILRITFAKADASLPAGAAERLDGFASRLAATEVGRVQISAYADDPNGREARRLSLARAEAVRSRLIEKGIRSTRINLRALGDAPGDGPSDRADIVIVN